MATNVPKPPSSPHGNAATPPPVCPEHPGGRVRKHGTYGRDGRFVKWECVPGNGDAVHMVRTGGANRARFTAAEKARALTRVAGGVSYREAAESARAEHAAAAGHDEMGIGLAEAGSRDGHIARKWADKYTPALAEHYGVAGGDAPSVLDELKEHADVDEWASVIEREQSDS